MSARVDWAESAKPNILPSVLYQGSNYSQFSYGAARNRFKQVAFTATGGNLPAGTETTLYVGGLFERITKPSGVIEYKHYLMAGKEPVALRTVRSTGANDIRYLHKDHLGSLDAVTDEFGNVVLRESFDAFGKRRSATTWTATPSASDWTTIAANTHRGYTFHEQLDNVGLIHMNGRVYDPVLGRFLSADPTIQAPFMSQSLNRYSYVMNNPLSLIDPSGFSWLSKALHSVGKSISTYWRPILAITLAIVTYGAIVNYMAAAAGSATGAAVGSATYTAAASAAATSMGTMAAAGAAAGFVSGAVMGGLKGAVTGAVSGAFFGMIGGYYKDTWNLGRMIASGVVGGATSEVNGGDFSDGFCMGAGISVMQWGATAMRQAMVEQSKLNQSGLNASGKSRGWMGDFFKLGGGRVNEDMTMIPNSPGSPLGGWQRGPGRIAGLGGYETGSWKDILVESYAGPHDWFSSMWYSSTSGNFINISKWLAPVFWTHSMLNLLPATAFVGAQVAPGLPFMKSDQQS